MKGCVYIQRAGDQEVIAESVSSLSANSGSALIESYNDAQTKGFFGVHRQALFIIALHLTFMKRFGKSPFKVTDNTLIEFTQAIALAGDSWDYVE